MLKIDLHVHTDRSPDSVAGARRVLDSARRRGLSAIAVTDHDTAEGGLRAAAERRDGDPAVIPGAEFTVPMGRYGLHIIGLFITRAEKPRSWDDAVAQIRGQKGVVVIPHLFREGTGLMYHLGEGNIQESEAERLLAEADYVEGINGKSGPEEALAALEFLGGRSMRLTAGTDAHVPAEVGVSWTEVDDLVEFKRGRAGTRACIRLKGPAPRQGAGGGNFSRRADWFRDLLIGRSRAPSARFGDPEWRGRLKRLLSSFPFSLAGGPLLQYYRGYRSAMAEDALSKSIESELGGSFEAVLTAARGGLAVEPREGSAS